MSPAPDQTPPPAAGGLREVRFSLRGLLAEVADERRLGSFGAEKMHQAEVQRVFRKKKGKPRG
jgi:hypothetical protein